MFALRSYGLGVCLAVLAFGATLEPAQARNLMLIRPPTLTYDGPEPPWQARSVVTTARNYPRGEGLIDLSRWPEEPDAEAPALKSFAAALGDLCTNLATDEVSQYAEWMITYGAQFKVDPFLLAALVYDRSHCNPDREKNGAIGLAGINEKMHRPFVSEGRYQYWTREGQEWREQQLDVSAFSFAARTLRDPETNIFFAAALLSIYKQQCRDIDGAFHSVPHRHYVSHMIWGDRVRDGGQEDRILCARRRLIARYTGAPESAEGAFEGLALHSPVEGWPRKITSGLGEPRDGGRRRHRGVDFDSRVGEPVRAIAGGVVLTAGVDMRRGPARNMPSARARRVRLWRMGPGGLIVLIRHENGLTSGYMHLSSYTVQAGDEVQPGQLIGYVGRSGIRRSIAHLHFELRYNGQHLNPLHYLGSMVFPPEATYVGQRRRAMRRRARRLRWRRARQLKAQSEQAVLVSQAQ